MVVQLSQSQHVAAAADHHVNRRDTAYAVTNERPADRHAERSTPIPPPQTHQDIIDRVSYTRVERAHVTNFSRVVRP